MAHRSGCKGETVGCYAKSWGSCARNAHLRVAWANSANGIDLTKEKKFDAENERFAQAVRDGLEPEGVSNAAIDQAYIQAEKAVK